MNHFFFQLTMRNWGCPYHFILTDLGTFFSLYIVYNIKPLYNLIDYPGSWIFIVFLIINSIGLIYEKIQLNKGADKRDSKEDLIANCLGSLIGIIKFILSNMYYIYVQRLENMNIIGYLNYQL